MADDFSFSIEEHIGVVSQGKGGWQVELNLVSWSGREAKYDIRSWSPDHQKMGKGITMTREELRTLGQIINTLGD
ncbi:MAG: YdbC family protein [Spirochaetaceae bacterium]|nr:YdbC family protein [Spirochaetaceae bacterium]